MDWGTAAQDTQSEAEKRQLAAQEERLRRHHMQVNEKSTGLARFVLRKPFRICWARRCKFLSVFVMTAGLNVDVGVEQRRAGEFASAAASGERQASWSEAATGYAARAGPPRSGGGNAASTGSAPS